MSDDGKGIEAMEIDGGEKTPRTPPRQGQQPDPKKICGKKTPPKGKKGKQGKNPSSNHTSSLISLNESEGVIDKGWNIISDFLGDKTIQFTSLSPAKIEKGTTKTNNAYNLTDSVIKQLFDSEEYKQGFDVTKWERFFKQVITNQTISIGKKTYNRSNTRRVNVFKLIAGFSLCDPREVFQDYINDDKLDDNKWTRIWRAATNAVGTNYNQKQSPPSNKQQSHQQTLPSLFGTSTAKQPAKKNNPNNNNTPLPTILPAIRNDPNKNNNKDDSTNLQNELRQQQIFIDQVRHIHRFDIVIPVGKEKNIDQKKDNAIEWLRNWLEAAHNATSSQIFILPWWKRNQDNIKIIDTPELLMDLSWLELQRYLPKLVNPKKATEKIFTSIRLGSHSEFASSIRADLFWFYDSNKGSLYPKPINDAENPVDIGMLTVSGNFSNPDSIQEKINEAIRDEDKNFTIGCKLRKLPQSKFRGCDVTVDNSTIPWYNKTHMAVMIEVDKPFQFEAKKVLCELFNDLTRERPGGLLNRFLPTNDNVMVSNNGNTKYVRMWEKHKILVNQLQNISIRTIIDLDTPLNETNNITIRKILSKKKNAKGTNIFKSMDNARSFIPEAEAIKVFMVNENDLVKAKEILDILPAKVMEKYGIEARKWFTNEAINMANDVTFLENGEFSTKDDEMFALLDEEDFGCEITFDEGVRFDENKNESRMLDDGSFYSFSTELGKSRSILRNSIPSPPKIKNGKNDDEDNDDNNSKDSSDDDVVVTARPPKVTPPKNNFKTPELESGSNNGKNHHSKSGGSSN